MNTPDDYPLDSRDGLPEALQVLLADYPKAAWEAHPNFSGLVAFWLERHMMFRNVLGLLEADVQARIDRSIDPQTYAKRLGRYGSNLVQGLHGHHQIEDGHYFPILKGLDVRLERGFEILDRDHHAMDGLLDRFARSANAVLSEGDDDRAREHAVRFGRECAGFARMLHRHLDDEEQIIVPVILKNGAAGLA
ncbi:hemerythrin domain-containing protein [Celeribacter marinus]|uniref:hemerythrin domain-containing protein n=1 Tax=Celeribacter marinus TaxID=1397108 RepID=UPI003F6BE714